MEHYIIVKTYTTMNNDTIIENCAILKTPIGRLVIKENGTAVTAIRMAQEKEEVSKAQEKEAPLLRDIKNQLQEYFNGQRRCFDLPLQPAGTTFQQKVWQALRQIPYGETRSYKELADMIGNPKACRAVGGANNKNPILILIPCHRVIGTDGSLTGFAAGLSAKKYLLELEQKTFV